MVASAAPALPFAAATEAEEVGHMCRQLRQCIGACQLDGNAISSSRAESDESDADISPIQVGLRWALSVIHFRICWSWIDLHGIAAHASAFSQPQNL